MITTVVESVQDNVARVKAQVSSDTVDRTFSETYSYYSRRAKIPGFRKGKVPKNILIQRIGMEALQGDVLASLKEDVVNAAIKEHNLKLRPGRIDWTDEASLTEGAPLELGFSVPVQPNVKVAHYDDYEIAFKSGSVTTEMKENYKESLRKRFGRYVPVEGAAVEMGAVIRLTFQGQNKESGEQVGFNQENVLYVVQDNPGLPGFSDNLLGMQDGQVREFDYVVPDSFPNELLRGNTLSVKATVHEVGRIEYPECDEAFVKEHLKIESLEKFDEVVDSVIANEIKVQDDLRKRDILIRRLIEESEVDITPNLIEDEMDFLTRDADENLRRMGSSLDEYLKKSNKTLQEWREESKKEAADRIKLNVILNAVGEKEGVEVTREDLAQYLYNYCIQNKIPTKEIKSFARDEEFVSAASTRIFKEKVVGKLVSKVRFLPPMGESEGIEKSSGEARPESAPSG